MPKYQPKQDHDAGLPVVRSGGRFLSKYDPDIALQIVERLAAGETLSKICVQGSGFPQAVTFKRWVIGQPELAKAVEAARLLSAQSMEEEALDAAREIKRAQRDGTQVRAVEVLLQQLRWSMERRDAARFGTKAPISIRVPVQIITSMDLGAVSDDTIDGRSIYTISAKLNSSVDKALNEAKSDQNGSKAPSDD